MNSIADADTRTVLATGRLVGEGFDDPRLDTLFLAMPFSFKGTIIQYAGRLQRAYPGKTKIQIFDYYDSKVSMLSSMFDKRTSVYRSLGYQLDDTN